jgi:hypothetical protein
MTKAEGGLARDGRTVSCANPLATRAVIPDERPNRVAALDAPRKDGTKRRPMVQRAIEKYDLERQRRALGAE